ncbi:PREDICTED: large subunit GTPase 1 homolog [Nicrophorus vespilloides]|uniref:Large subunit GTPase 1 homolog n=1 Tax=Nicrophorus vespilloides TaxID=110193 RepID=A0ABM1M932_NICVS|nr:PREDICTED: large subunit GTPase 1 homolog [Nicrophorus vespilloides]
MSRKNKGSGSLGRTLIKDRFGGGKARKYTKDNSMLHTTEIQDGYDWGRLNLQSVTEESSFQEFLSTAELAGTEFQAEKLNIKFVNPKTNIGLLTKDEIKKVKADHEKHKEIIKIPRRPVWNSETTTEELQLKEKDSFLDWRRSLAILQEEEGLLLTPYEKNLEFWRQLWRVVEKSDVVVQIVDARNPLLFRCQDLEKYVKEVSDDKMNMILINKADFLTEEQRQYWADYFTSQNMKVAFFSAVLASEAIEEEEEEEVEPDELRSREIDSDIKSKVKDLEEAVDRTADKLESLTKEIEKKIEELAAGEELENKEEEFNSNKLLNRDELITLFRSVHNNKRVTENIATIGLVGYPNVGKSSTINALMTVKKVSVSATPGKTKHFQTLYLDKDILLCDCPGLVMPSFVFTKAEMVINGILPIDQMRDHVPPVNAVCHLIPRHVIEDKYGIMIALPMEGEDPDRPPTSEELLNAYGYNRGFMTANGQPDNPRSARYVLKDFMNGKLLYANAPPGVKQEVYHIWQERQKFLSENHVRPAREIRAGKTNRVTTEDMDKVFFNTQNHGVHVRGNNLPAMSSNGQPDAKPWRSLNKQKNKNKREKSRRLYAHLDQH